MMYGLPTRIIAAVLAASVAVPASTFAQAPATATAPQLSEAAQVELAEQIVRREFFSKLYNQQLAVTYAARSLTTRIKHATAIGTTVLAGKPGKTGEFRKEIELIEAQIESGLKSTIKEIFEKIPLTQPALYSAKLTEPQGITEDGRPAADDCFASGSGLKLCAINAYFGTLSELMVVRAILGMPIGSEWKSSKRLEIDIATLSDLSGFVLHPRLIKGGENVLRWMSKAKGGISLAPDTIPTKDFDWNTKIAIQLNPISAGLASPSIRTILEAKSSVPSEESIRLVYTAIAAIKLVQNWYEAEGLRSVPTPAQDKIQIPRKILAAIPDLIDESLPSDFDAVSGREFDFREAAKSKPLWPEITKKVAAEAAGPDGADCLTGVCSPLLAPTPTKNLSQEEIRKQKEEELKNREKWETETIQDLRDKKLLFLNEGTIAAFITEIYREGLDKNPDFLKNLNRVKVPAADDLVIKAIVDQVHSQPGLTVDREFTSRFANYVNKAGVIAEINGSADEYRAIIDGFPTPWMLLDKAIRAKYFKTALAFSKYRAVVDLFRKLAEFDGVDPEALTKTMIAEVRKFEASIPDALVAQKLAEIDAIAPKEGKKEKQRKIFEDLVYQAVETGKAINKSEKRLNRQAMHAAAYAFMPATPLSNGQTVALQAVEGEERYDKAKSYYGEMIATIAEEIVPGSRNRVVSSSTTVDAKGKPVFLTSIDVKALEKVENAVIAEDKKAGYDVDAFKAKKREALKPVLKYLHRLGLFYGFFIQSVEKPEYGPTLEQVLTQIPDINEFLPAHERGMKPAAQQERIAQKYWTTAEQIATGYPLLRFKVNGKELWTLLLPYAKSEKSTTKTPLAGTDQYILRSFMAVSDEEFKQGWPAVEAALAELSENIKRRMLELANADSMATLMPLFLRSAVMNGPMDGAKEVSLNLQHVQRVRDQLRVQFARAEMEPDAIQKAMDLIGAPTQAGLGKLFEAEMAASLIPDHAAPKRFIFEFRHDIGPYIGSQLKLMNWGIIFDIFNGIKTIAKAEKKVETAEEWNRTGIEAPILSGADLIEARETAKEIKAQINTSRMHLALMLGAPWAIQVAKQTWNYRMGTYHARLMSQLDIKPEDRYSTRVWNEAFLADAGRVKIERIKADNTLTVEQKAEAIRIAGRITRDLLTTLKDSKRRVETLKKDFEPYFLALGFRPNTFSFDPRVLHWRWQEFRRAYNEGTHQLTLKDFHNAHKAFETLSKVVQTEYMMLQPYAGTTMQVADWARIGISTLTGQRIGRRTFQAHPTELAKLELLMGGNLGIVNVMKLPDGVRIQNSRYIDENGVVHEAEDREYDAYAARRLPNGGVDQFQTEAERDVFKSHIYGFKSHIYGDNRGLYFNPDSMPDFMHVHGEPLSVYQYAEQHLPGVTDLMQSNPVRPKTDSHGVPDPQSVDYDAASKKFWGNIETRDRVTGLPVSIGILDLDLKWAKIPKEIDLKIYKIAGPKARNHVRDALAQITRNIKLASAKAARGFMPDGVTPLPPGVDKDVVVERIANLLGRERELYWAWRRNLMRVRIRKDFMKDRPDLANPKVGTKAEKTEAKRIQELWDAYSPHRVAPRDDMHGP